MASSVTITNPIHISVQRPKISSLFLSPRKVSTSYGFFNSRALQHEVKESSLVFSPLGKKHVVPVHSSLSMLGLKQRRFHVVEALAADAGDSEIQIPNGSVQSSKSFGVIYCLVGWSLGLPKRAPIDKEFLLLLTPVAMCHALGHVMSNVSFAAVAVSFTHTIKALEPFFSASASQFVLGQKIPLSLWLSLAPVVIGVSMASLTELSFNWTGFISAMISNIAFTYRSIYSKKAMIEGPKLMEFGFANAIAKVGLVKFLSDLFWIGMFYHLYNQLATNTLERVAPLTHAVGNVLKRVFVIGFSIVVFGNKISTQTGIGTAIAIAGVAIYSLIKANMEEQKRKGAAALAN
ncbi:unnamed protein product [Lupinus luteus]|uniref:Sugar phosphate transporter domain-containing protein n=1 Tax=Lupinus luteus TaxID=3873 RepID=A0AAV1X9M2_LUPLU